MSLYIKIIFILFKVVGKSELTKRLNERSSLLDENKVAPSGPIRDEDPVPIDELN